MFLSKHTKKLSFGVAGIACASVFALVSGARGQTIFEHLGNTDPTTEGWTQAGPTVSGISAGPLTNDSGFDAWFVDDNSTVQGSSLLYSQVPTDSQIAQASAVGWTLRIRLRVVDVSDGVDSSVVAEYANGTRRYTIDWGSDSDGDPIILLATDSSEGVFTGPSFTLEGTGGGYHLYELVFDAVAGTADLFVDGIERISDYAGHTINVAGAGKRVIWGGGQSSTIGHGNYNFVEFASGCPCELLTTTAFLPPMGKKKKIGSTLPIKFQLFFDGVEIVSEAQLNQTLADNGLTPGCPQLLVFLEDGVLGLPVDDVNGNVGDPDEGDCFRYSAPNWIYNLRLLPPDFMPQSCFSVEIEIGDCVLVPDNNFFETK